LVSSVEASNHTAEDKQTSANSNHFAPNCAVSSDFKPMKKAETNAETKNQPKTSPTENEGPIQENHS
jgi:hypothetical protein